MLCEDGTVGIGEAGVHGWLRPAETMVNTCKPYLVGKDPSKVEHHIQYLQRSSHFMGSVISGALSAIDIALWDIKGKRLGRPHPRADGREDAGQGALLHACQRGYGGGASARRRTGRAGRVHRGAFQRIWPGVLAAQVVLRVGRTRQLPAWRR